MSWESAGYGLVGDNPIENPGDDRFHRTATAESLTQMVCRLPAHRGAAIGITGPWGSGKTSLLNLTEKCLKARDEILCVISFNPWLVAGSEEITGAMIREMSAQLEQRMSQDGNLRERSQGAASRASDVVARLAKYSGRVRTLGAVPFIGPWAQRAAEATEAADEWMNPKVSLEESRKEVTQALAALDKRIVVLVDDIDRLTPEELRDLFRAIRLTGSFPNVIYLLCLDERVVAQALSDENFDGSAYLEKILTTTCPVGEPAAAVLSAWFAEGLDQLLAGSGLPDPEPYRLRDVYGSVIQPLLRTPRDVNRSLSALTLRLNQSVSEILPEELISLEVVRVLHPALYASLVAHRTALTLPETSRSLDDSEVAAEVKDFVKDDILTGGIVAMGLVRHIFPVANLRLQEEGARLFGSDVVMPGSEGDASLLEMYLTGYRDPAVALPSEVRRVAAALPQREALSEAWEAISDQALADALAKVWLAVQGNEQISDRAAFVESVAALGPRLDSTERGFFGTSDRGRARQVMLQSLAEMEAHEVELLAETLIDRAPLQEAFETMLMVGWHENAGRKMVPRDVAERLQGRLAERLRNSGGELASQPRLLEILFHTLQPTDEGNEPCLPALLQPEIARALLRSSVAVTRRSTLGSDRVDKTYGLSWHVLLRVFGGEDNLRHATAGLTAADDDADGSRALDLCRRYLEGWRPPDLFDRG